jgi:hypothetical protein
MSINYLFGSLRLGLAALLVVAAGAALCWVDARPPGFDAEELATDPEACLGREVIVTGEWVSTAPSEPGYLVVVLRGREGGRVVCHFEDVPAVHRAGLETRLLRAGVVTIRGRCDGVADRHAILRNCRLLD